MVDSHETCMNKYFNIFILSLFQNIHLVMRRKYLCLVVTVFMSVYHIISSIQEPLEDGTSKLQANIRMHYIDFSQ